MTSQRHAFPQMAIFRKIRTYAALPWSEKLALFEALLLLSYARILVTFVPLSKWRGDITGAQTSWEKDSKLFEQNLAVVRMVRRCVQRVSKNSPVAFICLPQALSARWMLARRGVETTLFIGTKLPTSDSASDGTPREFHAWLKSGSYMVTGDCRESDYAVLTAG